MRAMISSAKTSLQEDGRHVRWQCSIMRASDMQACWETLLGMKGVRPADWTSGGRRVQLMTSPAPHAGSIQHASSALHDAWTGAWLTRLACSCCERYHVEHARCPAHDP